MGPSLSLCLTLIYSEEDRVSIQGFPSRTKISVLDPSLSTSVLYPA